MDIGKNKATESSRKRFLKVAFVGLILGLGIGVCIVVGVKAYELQVEMGDAREVARESEQQTVATQEREVSGAVSNFELVWHGFPAHLDPQTRADVATGPYLEHMGRIENNANLEEEPYWLVTTAVTPTVIQVYNYEPNRLKAGACLEKKIDKVIPGGEFVGNLSHGEQCGIYVFIRENNLWKLTGFFNTTLPHSAVKRDWIQAPDWLKEIIGDLPEDFPTPGQTQFPTLVPAKLLPNGLQ
jgi:hypothetical protein